MPLSDVLVAALSRPAGKVVDSPVRAIVDEILKERGYASPAEVSALKDDAARLKRQVEGLAERLEALSGQLQALRPAVEAAQQRAGEAEQAAAAALARAEAAEARLAASPAPAAPASPAEEPVAEAAAEPTAGCKVPDCEGEHHAQGFCRSHLHRWRAGRLPGFVSPEGLLEIDGRAHRVSADLAGLPYKISEKDGRLRVAGRLRAVTPL